MSAPEKELQAAEYALGCLDAAERTVLDATYAGDDEFWQLVAAWEQRLAPIALDLPPEAPPAELFASIEAAIGSRPDDLPGTKTVRAGTGVWRTLAEGVTFRVLHQDRASGRRTWLIRMDAGAHYASHAHEGDEECIVLEGEVWFDDLRLCQGDFHLARAGATHPTARTPTGCLLYVSGVRH